MLWFEGAAGLLLLTSGSMGWRQLRRRPGAADDHAPRTNSLSGLGNYPPHRGPGRFAAMTADDDEAFLRYCRERAGQQRREFRLRRDPLPEAAPGLDDGLSGVPD